MKRFTLYALPIIFFLMLYHLAQGQVISKIYLYGDVLLRATPGEGVRFYDIADPTSPRQTDMVKLEGSHDVAVHRNYMYVDNNADLIVYYLRDMQQAVPVDTIRNVFPPPVVAREISISLADGPSSAGLNSSRGNGAQWNASHPTGKGGSLARFAIVSKYLYCIDGSNLKVFDISQPQAPRYKNSVTIGWDIETLFPHGKHLFIGGQQGMYIYDINNPEAPERVSQFTHARSCDPVVVEGDRAYVTLRSGSVCGGGRNVLDILDISDIRNPRLLQSVSMEGPFGLTVRDQIVLVCDGRAGLVALNAKNPQAVRQVGAVTGITPHDIILDGRRMIVTAESGFYLYDAENLAAPKLRSKLAL